MTADDMKALFEAQFAASRAQPAPDAAARRTALSTLEKMVLDNADAIVSAIAQDFRGRARAETELLEIVPTVRAIRHARRRVARWMRPQRRPVDIVFQPSRAWVRREPLGVIGIISPWNYPLQLALIPLCDALAAGNRAMMKPSELTPAFSALLERLVSTCFNTTQVAVVTGGVETARAFSALPFDHLVFTGSTAVGREVMKAAAQNLTPVTLELGGKSPAIVDPDYPLDRAARSIASGKFLNAGQTCIAPDYALVPAGKVDAFARAVLAQAERAYPAIAGNDDYTAIIDDRRRARLEAAVAEARFAGATVLASGETGNDTARFAPTVVIGAPAGSALMTEEIFGPILPVVPDDTLEEAIAFVAARDRPLALYLFSNDRAIREEVLSRTISGGVTLNGTLLHMGQEALPFGGVGSSGMGAYHGRAGFERFSHARAVHQVGPVNLFERLGPPWGRLGRMVGRLLSRL